VGKWLGWGWRRRTAAAAPTVTLSRMAPSDAVPQRRNRVAGAVGVAAVLIGTFYAGIRVAPRLKDGPDNSVPAAVAANVGKAKSLDDVVAKLEGEGIVVRPNVRDSLEAILWWWERRPDLQAAFGASDGGPEMMGLLQYAADVDDATAVSLVPYRPGLTELRGRMGIINDTDADIHGALFWGFANRRNPQIESDPVITRLAKVWLDRPELRRQFMRNGRLQLVPFVFWASTVPSDDPDYKYLSEITFQLEQLPAELPAEPEG
jgi:hypothetical protein